MLFSRAGDAGVVGRGCFERPACRGSAARPGPTSVAESRKPTPQDLSLADVLGFEDQVPGVVGHGHAAQRRLDLVDVDADVVKPHSQLTWYWLPGSSLASCAWSVRVEVLVVGQLACRACAAGRRRPGSWPSTTRARRRRSRSCRPPAWRGGSRCCRSCRSGP